jgi:hypothetical protein
MEAVRPPLFFFCFFIVVTCLYVLGLILWKKRDERQRDANKWRHSARFANPYPLIGDGASLTVSHGE